MENKQTYKLTKNILAFYQQCYTDLLLWFICRTLRPSMVDKANNM